MVHFGSDSLKGYHGLFSDQAMSIKMVIEADVKLSFYTIPVIEKNTNLSMSTFLLRD